jgi:hypothetical protein
LIAGAILAIAAAALTGAGDVLGLDLGRFALLGIAVGAVLGIVPSRVPPAGAVPPRTVPSAAAGGRAGAWAAGVLAAWLGYAARLALLPDTSLGRAVAVAVVVLAVTAVAALSLGWLPLWAGLLGVASMVAAYDATFAGGATTFWSDSTGAVTTLALAAGLGFLATSLMVHAVPAPEGAGPRHAETPVPGQRDREPDVGMGIVDWSRSEA